MKKITFAILLVLVCAASGYSQNVKTSTIQWTSSKTMNVNLGDSNDENTTIITTGTTRIEWKNQDGSMRKSFQVIEVIGDWTNAASQGSLTYEVTDGTNSGTITLRKDAQGTKVLVVIVTDPPQITELTIQSQQSI